MGKLVDVTARALGLILLWIVISEGRPDFWYYGVITVVPAVAVSAWTLSLGRRLPTPVQWWLGVRFVGWFAGQSVAGAVDVARRALGPARLVDPVEELLPLHVPPRRGRLLAAACCNLMPGSLVYQLADGRAGIHSLAPELGAAAGWEELQNRIEQVTESPRVSAKHNAAAPPHRTIE